MQQPPSREPSSRRTAVRAVLRLIFGVLLAVGVYYTFLLAAL